MRRTATASALLVVAAAHGPVGCLLDWEQFKNGPWPVRAATGVSAGVALMPSDGVQVTRPGATIERLEVNG